MIVGSNTGGNIEFYTINGTFASSTAWTDYYSLPSSWTNLDKVVIVSFDWYYSGSEGWRSGYAVGGNSFMRAFIDLNASGLRGYSNNSIYYSTPFRVVLAYLK